MQFQFSSPIQLSAVEFTQIFPNGNHFSGYRLHGSNDGTNFFELYSNPNEVVLTPFMGVGSEVFSPVSMGRKAIGIELKDSYFKQATLNLKEAERRFNNFSNKQIELF